jgi:uncharacterized protein (TIGR00255 family)
MAESMTGYGRGEHRGDRYQVAVEIRSVNHRFLDLKLRLPRELGAVEQQLRATVRKRISRGAVDASVWVERAAGTEAKRFVVDEELLRAAAEGITAAGRALGTELRPDLAVLAQFREIFRFEAVPDDPGQLQAGAEAAFGAALEALVEARRREGGELVATLTPVVGELGRLLAEMREQAPAVARQLKETVAARAAELLAGAAIAPERLEQEAALLAMKSDVSEELARFGGHLDALAAALAGSGPAGRQMDFLLQEMNRELNTAAAKAGTFELAQLAISGKLELEKVREQVQNLA